MFDTLTAIITGEKEGILASYKQRFDGEDFYIPSGEIYRIACCDCGLIHDFIFVSEDGKPINVAARRNNRSTAQRRRNMKKHGQGWFSTCS
jgi:hypothetical protein